MASFMRNHVLSHWAKTPLGAIDQLVRAEVGEQPVQQLGPGECHRMQPADVGGAEVGRWDRLITHNPADGVRLPKRRQHAGSRQTIDRDDFTGLLLPAVPQRYRAVVGLAGGTGLRWGECIGLHWDSIDLTGNTVRVERVAVEDDHSRVTVKPVYRSHVQVDGRCRSRPRARPPGPASGHLRSGAARGGVRQRSRYTATPRVVPQSHLGPSLVRAGLLGHVTQDGDRHVATWQTDTGATDSSLHPTAVQAVHAVASVAAGGLRFHDLRHSYASWLITAGVPVPDVQKVMGHENPTTTLAIYTHVQSGLENRVLGALAAFSLPGTTDGTHGKP